MTTTPYAVSTNIGSVSYNNYVNAPITGPLSTNQTPSQIPYHSYGTLTGVRPTPPQFYPSQQPVDAAMNTNARYRYLRTAQSIKALAIQRNLAIAAANKGPPFFNFSTGKHYATSGHLNYIQPIPSSLYVEIKKSNAVGQSAYKVNLPVEAPISTKNYMPSSTRSSLRRARSGGCTAPKKKGAIQNSSLSNGATCGWGSIVRQNY
jgi:hypothetical protein